MSTEVATEIDKCRKSIGRAVDELEFLSERLAALKESLSAMDARRQSYYHANHLIHIHRALQWPHLDMRFVEQQMQTLEVAAGQH